MGRVPFNDVDNYGGGSYGNVNYFKLQNHKDVARVRFMLNHQDDLDSITFSVHRVQVTDTAYKSVSCLRAYNEPIEKCPFCMDNGNATLKFFIPLYNIDANEVQMWERGKQWASKLSGFMARYGQDTPLVNHIFEVERNGHAGDLHTTYECYEVGCDKTTLEDLPEAPEILGDVVLDKSADDMNFYLDTGNFPPEDGEITQRRENVSDDFMNEPEEVTPRRSRADTVTNNRRTPTNTSNNNAGARRRAF